MAIHILDCAPMSPWFPRWHIGAPCLLVETDQGLTLVDTGLGLHDFAHPSPIVRFFKADFGVQEGAEHTAVHQISRLGYTPSDIQHIIMTHLHFDHAGGLPDFPQAKVHVHRRELGAVRSPRRPIDLAYDPADFRHQPSWVLYDQPNAEWFGMKAIRLPFDPEMYFVPLFGHTRGHCGVAIRQSETWIFQCADALPTNAEFDITPQWLNRLVLGAHIPRLRALAAEHPEIQLLAGHMWRSFFDQRLSGH